MLDFVLLSLLLIASFLTLKICMVKNEADKYKKQNNLKISVRESNFKTFLKKINFFKRKDQFLSKQGYPLNLDVFSYYLLKLGIAIISMLSASINYTSLLIIILFTMIGYFLTDIYIIANKKPRNAEICEDLLNVANSISLQLSAHVALKDSLRKQFENCKNKDFRKAVLQLYMQYELSELNMEKSLRELKNKFDILEINMFCNALSQYNKIENIMEILENLSEILKAKYIDKLKSATRSKVIYITCGVILALGNIILITFYPLFISIGQGFNTIFN